MKRYSPRTIAWLAGVLVFAMAMFLPMSVADAATSVQDQKGLLRLSGPTRVSVSRLPVATAALTVSPNSIETGTPCGLADMCGLDPCLCGSAVDQWGACACNGLHIVWPSLSATSSDDGVVRVFRIGRTLFLIPTGVGHATVTVRGRLIHYDSATYQLDVRVGPAAFFEFLMLLFALVAVIAVTCMASVSLVRRLLIIRNRKRDPRRNQHLTP
jgi:hypothetical protein